ncbi:hypothetical protein EJ02DRAFT_396085 [Clathrospora elynae]|uniref:Zn(2)-C6 fungal-type domain-containing protein n=1 Tax=Clathrospora elynae TaxID=706981 RepID=A0A6A5T0K0_9PLEO|nr:hypothetical protein EJ02DRAFT_396085 [Clathrospora elynae]
MSLEDIVGAGACEACRGRITRCSTERPLCQECRRRRSPCHYVAPHLGRPVPKRKHDEMRLPHDINLEHIFVHLHSQPADVANEIFNRIRSGTDLSGLLRFIEYGNLRQQLMLVPNTSYQFTAPYLADMMPLFEGPYNPYMHSKLYTALLAESKAAPHGPEAKQQIRDAVYHIPYPGARIYDNRISPQSLKPHRWTLVSADDVFLTRLLEGYFLYEFPLWPCFHKDHFLDDMTTMKNDYCSPFLVSAILTAACHGLSSLKRRSEFWNPRTTSYQFMAETRRLWELEQARNTRSIATVQGATILGRICFANGMDTMGWTIWSQALAMADQLQLFSAAANHGDEKARISRTITAWGIFSQQSYSCFYLMKPPLARRPPDDTLPDFQHAASFFGEIWVKYPLAQHLVPIHLGQTYLALIRLRIIMNDIAGKALPADNGRSSLGLDQAVRYHTMLFTWFTALPEPLQPHNAAMPNQLLLHMQYHNLVTMTFLPFLESEASYNGPDNGVTFQNYAGFSPANLISSSKASLQTLLHLFYHRHGFEAYYIFLLQVLVQLGFDALARLRNPEVKQQILSPLMKATRATLILCAKGLRDQGHNFFLSELVFRILRDKMHPVDVRLLKDWAHIKDEDEREHLMMEHVHGEYPVNVESITDDPTNQRLHRLLTSMGDLKLPDERTEALRDPRQSRTWRSIVF